MREVFSKKTTLWKFWMDSVVFGEGVSSSALLIEPISCGLGKKWIVGLAGVNLQGYELVGASYRVLERDDDFNLDVVQRLVKELHNHVKKDRNHHLKVNLFSMSEENTPQQEALCLKFLLSMSLLNEVRVVYHRGKEKHRALELIGGVNWVKLKSNRSWSYAPESIQWENDQKLKIQVRGHWTESVFGEKIRAKQVEQVKWDLAVDGKLDLVLPDKLQAWLQSEDEALSGDMPKVVYQDRAWLYLDKGRAWGLKMKDRLSFLQGQIKGHVVGFYGPRAKVTSRNRLVSEGAIVYIRKGQHLVKEGQVMKWDVVDYPTAWR